MKLLIVSQGSQSIQLIRELFCLGYTPTDLTILTINGTENKSFLEYLNYYKIDKHIVDTNTINKKIIEIISSNTYDVLISFSNPFILSNTTLNFGIKCINFHPGILPDYKGSLCTVHSLINGESFVGGTWHWMEEKVDCGNIIDLLTIKIMDKDNAFTLHHKIFRIGIQSLESVLDKVKHNYKGIEQTNFGNFYYNKFPDISALPKKLQEKIIYFPPKFM